MPAIFERLRNPDGGSVADLVRVLNEWSRPLNDLLNHVLLRGRGPFLATLSSGTTKIEHGLGRVPQHFFATPHTAGVTISDPGGHTKTHLMVQASAACAASLLIT